MTSNVTVLLTLGGYFPNDNFIDWIVQRALVLDLVGWVKFVSSDEIHIQVSGHPVLVEALETACSLGPIEVTVDSIETNRIDGVPASDSFLVV